MSFSQLLDPSQHCDAVNISLWNISNKPGYWLAPQGSVYISRQPRNHNNTTLSCVRVTNGQFLSAVAKAIDFDNIDIQYARPPVPCANTISGFFKTLPALVNLQRGLNLINDNDVFVE